MLGEPQQQKQEHKQEQQQQEKQHQQKQDNNRNNDQNNKNNNKNIRTTNPQTKQQPPIQEQPKTLDLQRVHFPQNPARKTLVNKGWNARG